MGIKYKVLGYEGSHYVIGLYDKFNLVMTFRGYPDRNPDFFNLYPKEYINYKRDLKMGSRKVHYSDIEF